MPGPGSYLVGKEEIKELIDSALFSFAKKFNL